MPQTALAPIDPSAAATATDMVFEALYQAVIQLKLPPGTKVSEAEIARQLDVSRQPVRDAFFRLSKLGFLSIRPQRATLITRISKAAVRRAAFIRAALEVECLTVATAAARPEDIGGLDALLAAQARAIAATDRSGFHALDDAFHRRICEIAGHGYVWTLIQEQKAHMDRVRFLSLSSGLQLAYDEHRGIFDAMAARDAAAAVLRLRAHLGRIHGFLEEIAEMQAQHFEAGR